MYRDFVHLFLYDSGENIGIVKTTNIIEHVLNAGQGGAVQKEKAISGFLRKA